MKKKKSAIKETSKANVNCLKFFPSFFEVKLTNSVRACSWVLSNSSTPWTAAYQAPLFMEFSRQENWHVCVLSCFSQVWLFMTPWTVARQVPLSMDFSRQLACPFLLQGIFPTQGLNPCPGSLALASRLFTTKPPGKPNWQTKLYIIKMYNIMIWSV